MPKTLVLIPLILILAVPFTTLVPGEVRLELYDVQDLAYCLPDFPSVDISLADVPATLTPLEPDIFLGDDLVAVVRSLIPGFWDEAEHTGVQFQNGLLIVRGTRAQHAAVRTILAGLRAKNDAITALGKGIALIERPVSKLLARD